MKIFNYYPENSFSRLSIKADVYTQKYTVVRRSVMGHYITTRTETSAYPVDCYYHCVAAK